MGEHRRTKIPEKFTLVPTEGLSELQRAWLMIGLFISVGNAGFPGALMDTKSHVTAFFDWTALVVLFLAVVAALFTWFADGLFARYLVLAVSVVSIVLGLVGLWLHLFQRDLPSYPGHAKSVISAACAIVLSLFSVSATRFVLDRASSTRS